jgi:hypothetical protein
MNGEVHPFARLGLKMCRGNPVSAASSFRRDVDEYTRNRPLRNRPIR